MEKLPSMSTDGDGEAGKLADFESVGSSIDVTEEIQQAADIKKSSTLEEMSSGTKQMVSSQAEINFIDDLRRRASTVFDPEDARIDNTLVIESKPSLSDMFRNSNTSTLAFIYMFSLAISFICFVYTLRGHKEAGIIVAFLSMVSNLFGLLHASYSGTLMRNVERLDSALQSLAQIIAEFAKAISIQEAYMDDIKRVIDYMDNLADWAASSREKSPGPAVAGAPSGIILRQGVWNEVAIRSRKKTVDMHIYWLDALFRQLQTLDNRLYMTPKDYADFVTKLPRKSRKMLQSKHLGLESRFVTLDDMDSTVVLPYQEAEDMVMKVIDDLKREIAMLDKALKALPKDMKDPSELTRATSSSAIGAPPKVEDPLFAHLDDVAEQERKAELLSRKAPRSHTAVDAREAGVPARRASLLASRVTVRMGKSGDAIVQRIGKGMEAAQDQEKDERALSASALHASTRLSSIGDDETAPPTAKRVFSTGL